jgi:hypothetical protein
MGSGGKLSALEALNIIRYMADSVLILFILDSGLKNKK